MLCVLCASLRPLRETKINFRLCQKILNEKKTGHEGGHKEQNSVISNFLCVLCG